MNDVVAWTFRGLRQNDVMQVDSVDQILDAQFNSATIQSRRCLNRLFQEKGVYHFASKAFLKQNKKDVSTCSASNFMSVDPLTDKLPFVFDIGFWIELQLK